jgi:hypothetical protein
MNDRLPSLQGGDFIPVVINANYIMPDFREARARNQPDVA